MTMLQGIKINACSAVQAFIQKNIGPVKNQL